MSSSSSSSSSTSAGSSSTAPASATTSVPASSSSSNSSGDASASASSGETSSPKRRRTDGVSTQSATDGEAMEDVPATTSAPVSSSASASSSSSSTSAVPAAASAAPAQSAALREQIRANLLRYLRQLTVGCGLAGCSNKDCVTGGAAPVAGNVALSRAQSLFKNHVPSCVPDPAGAAPVAASASPAVAALAAASSVAAAAPAATTNSAAAASTPAPASTPAAAAPSSSPAPATPARASPPAAAASPAPAATASSSAASISAPRPRTASSSGASAAAGPSSSRISPAAPSPPASPRVSPSLSAMLASSTPMAGPLKSTEAPIESVSAWVAQVDAARAAWVAMGSPANDVSPFRPLVTRLYKVFNELNCLNLSFRVTRSGEDEGVKQQRREEAREEEEKAALLAAASRRGVDAMSDAATSSSSAAATTMSTLTIPPPATAAAAPTSTAGALASIAPSSASNCLFLEADEWSPAIDYSDLDAFYASIFSVSVVGSDGAESFPLLTAMLNGMRALLNELLFRPLPASQVHPVLLRAVLILLHASPADEAQDVWTDPAHYDTLRLLTQFVASLPRPAKKLLVSWFSDVERWRPGVPVALSARQRRLMYSRERLEKLLGSLQQFISVRIFDRQDLRDCVPAIMTISLVHEANERLAALYRAIPLSVPRSAKAPVPLDEKLFYNDAVNEVADLKADFRRWMEQLHGRRVGAYDFSFSKYSFVLDAGSKAMLLKYDAQMQQHAQYRAGILGSHTMSEREGYLILEVARANLVADTMRALANKSPLDYKKPLKVHFKGEKGIDAGGLRKEFFQLIVAALFDARYGMFLVDQETHTFRFNPDSMDAPMEFELIGALLGISIYNSTILDMHFPQVVYKQLLGQKPTLDDLLASQPSLGKGLQQLLEFDGDVETTFARDFTVSYERYGEQVTVELKPGGANIPVTNANRHEFVSLYVEYALEKSIAKQFGAFNKGFQRACGGEALRLFRPFELELLVCGAQEFDFDALEASTRYEDGYTKDSPICKQFWEIVHQELTLEEKKRLLEFCTGSDRVPIKGLAAMQLTISKQGPDSPQLPTSHTCFNHLLLPDYSSKDKLRTLLRLALQNSKGFGLI